MSSSNSFHPLSEPLIEGQPDPRCRASVIIPARNEEASLIRTLDALRDQRDLENDPLDPATYEVILLLNNCTDASLQVATTYQSSNPGFRLHIATRDLPSNDAHVGTARRLLMDTAWHRLRNMPASAILSTDADTTVAPDWIAHNLAALFPSRRGKPQADVVGGVIHLFPEDQAELARTSPGTWLAYQRDRDLQRLVAHLESLLDPDPADPWPRHLEHFGASLACTPEIYARAGGLPPVKPLEDVAFIDALRKVGARIRHCPDTHIFTSARLEGRAEVGLSGQLRHWQREADANIPHLVDSAEWLEHRFRSIAALRRLNESSRQPCLTPFPEGWRARLAELHAERLPTPRFLERLDCNALIEETFLSLGHPRRAEITQVLSSLSASLEAAEIPVLVSR
jgi:hypothetical protein